MKVLHIAQNTIGFEEVTLLANAVDKRNNLAVIEKNGQIYYTGGFLLNDTPEIRAILNNIPNKDQYEFVKTIKVDPFVAFYYDKEKVKQQDAEIYSYRNEIEKPSFLARLIGKFV